MAEIAGCIEASPTPGMRFAAGYGRAVLGAALAYVREQKEGPCARSPRPPSAAAALALAGD